MAGTVTFTVAGRHMIGNRRLNQIDANISSYATGGVTVTPGNCGLRVIDTLDANKSDTSGFKYGYDVAGTNAQLLSAFDRTGTQVANGNNHGIVRLTVIGQ